MYYIVFVGDCTIWVSLKRGTELDQLNVLIEKLRN